MLLPGSGLGEPLTCMCTCTNIMLMFLFSLPAHRPVPATSDMDLSVMRNRIAELKAQIGKENTRDRTGAQQPEREGSFVSCTTTRTTHTLTHTNSL